MLRQNEVFSDTGVNSAAAILCLHSVVPHPRDRGCAPRRNGALATPAYCLLPSLVAKLDLGGQDVAGQAPRRKLIDGKVARNRGSKYCSMRWAYLWNDTNQKSSEGDLGDAAR